MVVVVVVVTLARRLWWLQWKLVEVIQDIMKIVVDDDLVVGEPVFVNS